MITTSLRKVGGSIMLAVPPALLDLLNLRAGSAVSLAVDGHRLVVEPGSAKRYTLQELLAQGDPNADPSEEERAWMDDPARGRELL